MEKRIAKIVKDESLFVTGRNGKVDRILSLLEEEIKKSLLAGEEIAESVQAKVDNPVYWVDNWLIDFSTELRWIAQAQLDKVLSLFK